MKKETQENKDRRVGDRRNPDREKRINAVFDELKYLNEKRTGERRKADSNRRLLK